MLVSPVEQCESAISIHMSPCLEPPPQCRFWCSRSRKPPVCWSVHRGCRRLTADLEDWVAPPAPLLPIIRDPDSRGTALWEFLAPGSKWEVVKWERLIVINILGWPISLFRDESRRGLTYFLLASRSASDSSSFLASSRNFFILSFISLFLANSCLMLSSKPERKPFLLPEE